jgi:hypothetical protein
LLQRKQIGAGFQTDLIETAGAKEPPLIRIAGAQ